MKAWVARDKDGSLFMYNDKTYIFKNNTRWIGWYKAITEQDLPEGINPQWSDDEPIEVEFKLERAKL